MGVPFKLLHSQIKHLGRIIITVPSTHWEAFNAGDMITSTLYPILLREHSLLYPQDTTTHAESTIQVGFNAGVATMMVSLPLHLEYLHLYLREHNTHVRYLPQVGFSAGEEIVNHKFPTRLLEHSPLYLRDPTTHVESILPELYSAGEEITMDKYPILPRERSLL